MAQFQLSCWWDAQRRVAGRSCRARGQRRRPNPLPLDPAAHPMGTGPALGLGGVPSPARYVSEAAGLAPCLCPRCLACEGPRSCSISLMPFHVCPSPRWWFLAELALSLVRGLVTCSPNTGSIPPSTACVLGFEITLIISPLPNLVQSIWHLKY